MTAQIKDMAAFAWNGFTVYGDNSSIEAVHAAVTDAAKLPDLRGRLGIRPDWGAVYGDTARPPSIRDNNLVAVTRETARLALSAIREQQKQDAYHNYGAAQQELSDVLGGSP